MISVRLDVETIRKIDAEVNRLGSTLRQRITRSDVVRLAIEDYLRRNQ